MVTPLDILNRARKKNSNGEVDRTTLEQGSQGTITNIEFLDDVFGIAWQMSYDHGFNDFIEDLVLTPSQAEVAAGSFEWDANAIKEVKLLNSSGDRKDNLVMITPTKADNLKVQLTSETQPLYWYVDRERLFVLPTPDTAYNLTVRFQGLVPEITTVNVDVPLSIPKNLVKALVEGVYSRLLHEDGDPEWVQWDERFLGKLQLYLTRNRNNYRNAGLKTFRYRPRNMRI